MKKERQKMPVSQRAKQFAPFAAVGGLDEAIRKKEEEHNRRVNMTVVGDANPELNIVCDKIGKEEESHEF